MHSYTYAIPLTPRVLSIPINHLIYFRMKYETFQIQSSIILFHAQIITTELKATYAWTKTQGNESDGTVAKDGL